MNGISVAELLKSNTRVSHSEAEEEIMILFNRIRSRSDYADLLKIYFGFYFPLEKKTSRIIPSTLLIDISERSKTHLILQDLNSLGQFPDQIPLCEELPEINSVEEALGCLYVLEGSTLGGRVIARMLRKNENLELSGSELQFFLGYGEDTGKKWVSFLQTVNQFELQSDAILESAVQTFTLFKNWIRRNAKYD